MVGLENLISHRFRGFSEHENTISGLQAALDAGVLKLEFDIRVTRCGTPIIYHDEQAPDKSGHTQFLSDVLAHNLGHLGGTFSQMPLAEDLFAAASCHANQSAHFLIDIKDAGFETEIDSLVRLYKLQQRVTYVSWVPNVLYRMFEIAPDIPLCLSHWSSSPDPLTRKSHTVHAAQAGHIPRLPDTYIHGERSGWYVEGGLKGDMRERLAASGGSVCIPQHMADVDLIQSYQADGIKVSTFSYIDWPHIRNHFERFGIDDYFIDNRRVFDEL